MSDISFAHAWVLAFLLLVPVGLALWVAGLRRGQVRARALSRATPATHGYASAVMLSLAAALAIVAAAQPRWGTTESSVPRQGAELVIVMDVSRSMGATDVAPTRLAATKDAVAATLGRLGGDRVGLVVFAGDARLRFPLTTDFRAAEQVVRSLETGTVIVDGGSSTSQGLRVALDAFDLNTSAGRLVVLFTDGDDLGEDPGGAAERLQQAGIGLLVVGVGTPEGATVPVYDPREQGFVDKLGEDGEPIVSRLNEPFLRAVAATADGQYLSGNLGSVPGAVEGRIQALQRAEIDRQSTEIPIERFQWFAGAALVFLVLGSVMERVDIRIRRRELALAGAALALVLLSACATEAHDLNEQGREAMTLGEYERAVTLFQEAQAEEPDNADITLNLAGALHAAGRYDEAQLTARRVLGSNRSSVRARAHASIGHHRFAVQDLPGSLDAFRSALTENPGDEDSRHDYEVVLRLLSQQGDDPGQPDGNGADDPQPGETPEPGNGQPGEPQPGEPGEPGSTPQPGQPGQGGGQAPPGSLAEIQRRIDAIDAEIAELLGDEGEPPTTEEAMRILDLLAERARMAGARDSLDASGDPGDY